MKSHWSPKAARKRHESESESGMRYVVRGLSHLALVVCGAGIDRGEERVEAPHHVLLAHAAWQLDGRRLLLLAHQHHPEPARPLAIVG